MSATNKEIVGKALYPFLATSYMLYLKTQNFHWNVRGPHFYSLHKLFEEQYTDLSGIVDDFAERIRALGLHAPGSFKEYLELSKISEAIEQIPAMDMVKALENDHQTVADLSKDIIKLSEEHDDPETADMLIERVEVHEKAVWMLGAFNDS